MIFFFKTKSSKYDFFFGTHTDTRFGINTRMTFSVLFNCFAKEGPAFFTREDFTGKEVATIFNDKLYDHTRWLELRGTFDLITFYHLK